VAEAQEDPMRMCYVSHEGGNYLWDKSKARDFENAVQAVKDKNAKRRRASAIKLKQKQKQKQREIEAEEAALAASDSD
jgi:hypothetical protein